MELTHKMFYLGQQISLYFVLQGLFGFRYPLHFFLLEELRLKPISTYILLLKCN